MKKLLIGLAGLALWGSAQASVVSYDFTAVVNDIREYATTSSPQVNVQSSSMTGVEVNFGQVLHGHFDYNTSTPLSQTYQPPTPATGSDQLFNDNTGGSYAHFSVAGTHADPVPGFSSFFSLLHVANDNANFNGQDTFGVSTNAVSASGATLIDFIWLNDSTGQALNSGAIPAVLHLSSFDIAYYSIGYFTEAGSFVGIDATITSLVPTSPVPEPGSCAMLLAGIAVLARRHRARRV